MNLPPELISRAHKIKLNSKKISTTLQSGSSRSTKHGNGFSFDQLRDYDLGDDIRFIDWKASARNDSMLVKQFYEEKIKQVVVVADLTSSSRYSSQQVLREKIIKLSGSLIALASGHSHDAFGLISVGQTTLVRPMKSGLSHAYHCIEDLMNQRSGGTFVDITHQIQQITRGNASLVVFISDMLIPDIEQTLLAVAHKHDVLVIRCLDVLEQSIDLPVGLTVVDPETGASMEIGSLSHQTAIRTELQALYKKQETEFNSRRIRYLDVRISNTAIDELLIALS
jgi:uncharacterized protein (DUF58 family)